MKKNVILFYLSLLPLLNSLTAASFELSSAQIQSRLGEVKSSIEALSNGKLVVEIKNISGYNLSNLECKAFVDNNEIAITNSIQNIETFPSGYTIKLEFDYHASTSLTNGYVSFSIYFKTYGEKLVCPFVQSKALSSTYFIPNQGARVAAINALKGNPKINYVLFKQQLDIAIKNGDIAAKAWRLLVAHSGVGVYRMNPGYKLNAADGDRLLQQARQGNLESAYLLGALNLYKFILPGIIDENASHFLITLSAQQNYPPAQFFLGEHFLRRGSNNIPQGIQHLETAWKNGDARAARALSHFYINAPAGQKNLTKGRDWLNQAVAKGDPQANVIKAELLLEGESEAPNPVQALSMLNQAANNYNADAMVKLGYIYSTGSMGIPQDLPKGRTYYEKAANQTNDPEAMFWLGKWDYDRNSYHEAKYWLLKAAGNHNGKAMFLLASLYEKGLGGLEQSLVKQRYWKNQAALAGFTQAQDLQNSPFDPPLTALIPSMLDPDRFFGDLFSMYLENLLPNSEAFNKCELISDSTQVVLYAASMNGCLDSGIDLENGQMVQVNATGQILFGVGIGKLSPIGSDDPFFIGNRLSYAKDLPTGCLMYKIGEDGTWNIAGTRLNFTTTHSGRLYFCVNDNQAWNNKNYFDLKIEVDKKKNNSNNIIDKNANIKVLSTKIITWLRADQFENAALAARNLENTWLELYPELPNPYSCLIALAETRHNADCGTALKFEECFKFTYGSIKLSLALGSETQVLYHLQQLDYHFGSVLQIALENQNPCSKFAELAYDYALMTKGLVLERGDVERNLLNNSPNPMLKESIIRIKTLRRDISPVGLPASYAVPNTEMPNVITTLNHEIENLDHNSPELKHKLLRNYRWKDVHQQLGEDEASVEYLLMPSLNGNPQDTHLLAIVLSKSVGAPIMVKLGAYRELKAIFSKNFESDKSLKPGTTLFRGGEKSNPINSDPLVETPPDLALYNLIIAPMSGYILGIKRVYFSPVDILNFIPFEAIPHPSGKYLGELLELRQVYSTRRLAQPFQDNRSHGRLNVHAFGNINYGEMEFARWRALDETKLEIDSIAFICDTLKYKNVWRYQNHEASEELFNNICNQTTPSILHLATHGFYQPYEDKTKARYIDPMERAGLVLALANQYQPNKNTPSAKNDGWLFASEISQMDLAQVHLAVLSACESGLGDIVQNEGVFGLPRAFLKAGAQTLLVSLWPVKDDEARRFMVKFYENYLPGDISAYDALQVTRSFYRKDKELRAKVNNWAAWVLLE